MQNIDYDDFRGMRITQNIVLALRLYLFKRILEIFASDDLIKWKIISLLN